MRSADSALAGALSELAALGTERDREHLAALADRLPSARLRVLVVGDAKRGKSTLVNALLGREVLPTGVTPLTAVTTTGALQRRPARKEQELTEREAALHRVLGMLEQAAGPSAGPDGAAGHG